MTANNTPIIVILAVLAVALCSAGAGYAYAYSSSVGSQENSISGDWLSIDVFTGNVPTAANASQATSVTFTVDAQSQTYGVSTATYVPDENYSIRVLSNVSQSVNILGAFSTSSAAGAAILGVTFNFTNGDTMVLAGGHAAQGESYTPTKLTKALVTNGTFYVTDLVIESITLTLISEIQENSSGKAYVSVGGSGSEIPIEDLVNPNNLSFSFLTNVSE